MSMKSSLSEHWPEYLIEGTTLGAFMIVVGSLVTVFESPRSPIYKLIPSVALRVVLFARAIGMTLALVIQSPWGKRSGAHMNPAITLAFLQIKKIHPWDALFYVLAQTAGGTLGVVFVAVFIGGLFTDPPVQYAITVPGSAGEAALSGRDGDLVRSHGDYPDFHHIAPLDPLHCFSDRLPGGSIDHCGSTSFWSEHESCANVGVRDSWDEVAGHVDLSLGANVWNVDRRPTSFPYSRTQRPGVRKDAASARVSVHSLRLPPRLDGWGFCAGRGQ